VRVILRREVKGLGQAGDVREVADGYARNFLIPRALAVPASAQALNLAAQRRETAKTKGDRERLEAEQLAQALEAMELSFSLRAGAGGRVFGSVTNRDIAEALVTRGIQLDRTKVHLETPLRSLGTHRVEIRLHPTVRARLSVTVEADS
jgi:large subunit ribosomal protein L9